MPFLSIEGIETFFFGGSPSQEWTSENPNKLAGLGKDRIGLSNWIADGSTLRIRSLPKADSFSSLWAYIMCSSLLKKEPLANPFLADNKV